MKRSRLWLLIPGGVVVLGALSIAGWAFASQGKAPVGGEAHPALSTQPVPVKVAPVAKAEVPASLDYSGEVRATSTVSLLPKVGGRIATVAVDVGTRVAAGDLLVQLEHDQADLQLQQAEAALTAAKAKLATLKEGGRTEQVTQAEANLEMAKAKLATLQDGPRPETIAQAEANLKGAQAKLDALQKGPTPEQIAIAETQVRVAKDQLYAVQSQADAMLGSLSVSRGLTTFTEDMKEAQSGTAYEQVQLAEAQLAHLKAPPTAEAVAQAQAAVDAATQQLELAKNPFTENDLTVARAAVQVAEQAVAMAKTPATPNDLRAAEAGVEQARAARDLATLQVHESTIVSPIDGVVTDRLLSAGSLAGPTTPILLLAASTVEVTVNVEESKLGTVATGQTVEVTTAAYPGTRFAGTVRSIAPTVDVKSRTVAVKVQPQDPAGQLRPGMFAQLSIQTHETQASLLVPQDAVVGTGSQAAVFVVSQKRAYRRPVRTGRVQGESVEILSGVTDGQEIVVQGQSDLRDGQLVSVLGR